MADPKILDFTTTAERQPVRIDGVTYQMRLGSDMSFAERQSVAQMAAQLSAPIVAMAAGRRLPKGQARAVRKLLLEACGMAIKAPPGVLKKLDEVDQVILAVRFFERAVERLGALRALLSESPSPGPRPSPDSVASTAARRPTGSDGSRSASSKRT
jgi:hypothetical protein